MSTPASKKNDSDAFAENTALTDLLGDHPRTKILAVLLSEPRDINVSEISKQANMSRSTVYNHIEPLQELNVVLETRKVGGSPLYQINKDNPTAKNLKQLEWDLLDEFEEET